MFLLDIFLPIAFMVLTMALALFAVLAVAAGAFFLVAGLFHQPASHARW